MSASSELTDRVAVTTVALVAHRIADPAPSGIGRYYRELISAMARVAGPIGLVAVTPREPHRPDWLPAPVRRRTVPGPRRVLQFGWSAARRPWIDPWTDGADLVHALHTWAPVPTRRPLVVTVHDLMTVMNPGWYRGDHRWASRRALRYTAGHAARLVVVSSWVAAQVQSELGVEAGRIVVIHNGVADRFRTTPTRDQARAVEQRWGLSAGRYILAVGQVSARKNLVAVLRALAELGPERSHRLPLVIAGSPGPACATVLAEVSRLGLGDRVRLLGYVADDLLVPLVAGALMLVHPSTDEGFGLTPVEAMAAGTPVIASGAGSLPEVVGGAGMLVDPGDTWAWAAAMGRIISDQDERLRLTDAGHRRQADFTWAATARATLGVYREVLPAQLAP